MEDAVGDDVFAVGCQPHIRGLANLSAICLDWTHQRALFALIALGYTMVYGIIELINFAHGDVFMLGSFLALAMIGPLGLAEAEPAGVAGGIVLLLVVVSTVFSPG